MDRRRLFACMCAFSILSTSTGASAAYYTAATHSVNNEVINEDFKLSDSELDSIKKYMDASYMSTVDVDESDTYRVSSPERTIDGGGSGSEFDDAINKSGSDEESIAKSYLIYNNILSRKSTIECSARGGEIKQLEEEDEKAEKVFSESYSAYGSASPSTAKEALSQYKSFVAEIKGALCNSEMSSDGLLTESQIKEIEKTLKQYKKKLKKDLKKKGADCVKVYKAYVKATYNYAVKKSPNLRISDNSSIRKSDFLMLLSKAAFGVKKSRTIVYNASTSYRTSRTHSSTTADYWNGKAYKGLLQGYWDDQAHGYFGDAYFIGDKFYYVSSNVTELYLEELLNRKIIYKEEFSDSNSAKQFLNYNNKGINKSPWYPGNGLVSWGSKVFGATFKVSNNKYVPKAVSFFDSEGLTKMSVLEYVEDIMRQTDKNVSKTESDIVMYKLGLKYLQGFSGRQLETLKYLIVKGILNFDDPEEFIGLDEPATNLYAYKMLYRFHNKSARFDFSEVQLTDSDAYWQEKGYAEETIAVQNLEDDFLISLDESDEHDDIGDEDDEELPDDENSLTNVASVSKLKNLFGTVSAATKTEYKVAFNLSTSIDWKYSNISLSDLAKEKQTIEGVTVTTGTIKRSKKKIKIYKLAVVIKASSANAATIKVRKQLTCSPGSKDDMDAVTKVSGVNGSTNYTLISQTALKSSFSDISVIEDKVLLNTKTGTRATILPDNKYALVGNTVIHTDDLIMVDKSGNVEPYYSLNVIVSLLDNAYLKKIGYKKGIYLVSDNIKETMSVVETEYGDTGFKAHTGKIKVTKAMSEGAEEIDKGDIEFFYRVNDITQGLNSTIYPVKAAANGKKYQFYLAIDWEFAIPEVGIFEKGSKENEKLRSNSNLTNSELTDYLYTRPSGNAILEAWWDSNYLASNALANMLYGGDGVEFITSGYVVPNITVLYPKNDVITVENIDSWIKKIFDDVKLYNYSKSGEDEDAGKYFGGGKMNTWYQSFYDGAACFDWLEDAGKASEKEVMALEELTSEFRSFDIVRGQSTTKYNGYWFEGEWFLTSGGVLYRNLDVDSRTTYKLNKNKTKVASIKLQTRTASYVEPEENKTVVAVESGGKLQTNRLMLYKGTESINGVLCYKLAPISNFAVKTLKKSMCNAGYVQEDVYNYGESGGKQDPDKLTKLQKKYLSDAVPRFIRQRTAESNDVDLCKNASDVLDPDNVFWQSLYNSWNYEYLKQEVQIDLLHLKCYQAFDYDDKTKAVASKNGVKFDSNAVYYKSSAKLYKQKNKTDAVMRSMKSVNGYKIQSKNKENVKKKQLLWSQRAENAPLPNNYYNSLKGRTNAVKDGKALSSGVVYAVPVFYVPVERYKLAETKNAGTKFDGVLTELVTAGDAFAIQYGNYYYNSVCKAVQSALMAHYVETKQINQLGKGTQVFIGSIRFFIDQDGKGNENSVWVTSAILNLNNNNKKMKKMVKDAKAWRESKKSQNPFKSDVEKMFSGITIQCDNRYVPFVNYIASFSGNKGKMIQPAGLKINKTINKYGLVYLKDGTNRAWGYKKNKDKKITADNTTSYRFVRARMSIDGQLKVRPLDREGSKWELAPMIVAGDLGFGATSLGFFNESLSYKDNQYADIGIDSSRFTPSVAFEAAKQKFQKAWALAKAGDLKTMILFWIIFSAMYLCIISWMCFLILHYGVFRTFLEAIAVGPGMSTSSGIDIIKMMSFGLYDLNVDPPIWRIVAIQLGCAIIVVIAYNIM